LFLFMASKDLAYLETWLNFPFYNLVK
jgi:hypothetical protein